MKQAIILAVMLYTSLEVFSQSPVIYLNTDYSGANLALSASYPNLAGQNCQITWHRHIMSVRIPKGWQVELFAGADYSGSSIILTSDVSDLSTLEWEDKTASIRVSHDSVLGPDVCPCLKTSPSDRVNKESKTQTLK